MAHSGHQTARFRTPQTETASGFVIYDLCFMKNYCNLVAYNAYFLSLWWSEQAHMQTRRHARHKTTREVPAATHVQLY